MQYTSDELVRTRTSFHALAEHVLAAARHRATGRIGLAPTPGGLGTPFFDDGGRTRRLRIDGTDLVDEVDDHERRTAITTLAGAGDFFEVDPGAPADIYTPVTALASDVPLVVHPGAATAIAAWFELVATAIDRFVAAHPEGEATPPTLWPEHFDLAITMDEVNYGGTPGDDAAPLPYLYVGPWEPRVGPFWTESYGARLDDHDGLGLDGAVAFFEEGRRRAAADPLS